jgi:hypothetical protein
MNQRENMSRVSVFLSLLNFCETELINIKVFERAICGGTNLTVATWNQSKLLLHQASLAVLQIEQHALPHKYQPN